MCFAIKDDNIKSSTPNLLKCNKTWSKNVWTINIIVCISLFAIAFWCWVPVLEKWSLSLLFTLISKHFSKKSTIAAMKGLQLCHCLLPEPFFEPNVSHHCLSGSLRHLILHLNHAKKACLKYFHQETYFDLILCHSQKGVDQEFLQ